jgi:competence protein ComEA
MFKWLEKYLTFSRMERNAIVALLALSFIVLIAPRIYFYFKPVEHADNSKYKNEIEAFAHGNKALTPEEETVDTISITVTKDSTGTKQDTTHAKKHRQANYFEFDPNKIGVEDWVRLGFTEKQALSIEKYKASGGKFYRPQDLMRLYVMDEEHYYKLKPFVKIDVSALPERNYDRH